MKFGQRFLSSAKELKNLRSLVMIAMLLALRLALGYVTTIRITPNIKIGFTIFPTTVLCMMFGPVAGGIAGGVADLVGYLLKPNGIFFPGYTLDCVVAGLIYGASFYRRERISLVRVFLTLLTVTVVVNLGMTTTWIAVQTALPGLLSLFTDPQVAFHDFGVKFLAILPARALKNFIMLPINTCLVYLVLQSVRRLLSGQGVSL